MSGIVNIISKMMSGRMIIENLSTILKFAKWVEGTEVHGDSITAGFTNGPTVISWANQVETQLGITVNNRAVSSANSRHTLKLFMDNNPIYPTKPLGTQFGFNDCRLPVNYPTTALYYNTVASSHLAMIAVQFSKGVLFPFSGSTQNMVMSNGTGGNGTRSEMLDWSSRAPYHQDHDGVRPTASWFKKSVATGDTLSFNITVENFSIVTYGSDSSTVQFSRFVVTVDGVNKGTFDPNNKTYTENIGISGLSQKGIINDAHFVTGLTNSSHAVTITFLDNAVGVIDHIAILKTPAEAKVTPIYVNDLPHMNSVGYSYASGTTAGVLDAATNFRRNVIQSQLGGYQQCIAYVNINASGYYEPELHNDQILTDGIHPTTLGDTKIKNKVIEFMDLAVVVPISVQLSTPTLNVTKVSPTQLQAVLSSVQNASQYRFEVSPHGANTWTVFNQAGNSKAVTVSAASRYDVRGLAVGNGTNFLNSNYSNVIDITSDAVTPPVTGAQKTGFIFGQSNVGWVYADNMTTAQAAAYQLQLDYTNYYNNEVTHTVDGAPLYDPHPIIVGANTRCANGYNSATGNPKGGHFGMVGPLAIALHDYNPENWSFLQVAKGATSSAVNWYPTVPYVGGSGDMFKTCTNAMQHFADECVTKGIVPVVKFIYWYQGEEDSLNSTNTSNYATNQAAVLSALKTAWYNIEAAKGWAHSDPKLIIPSLKVAGTRWTGAGTINSAKSAYCADSSNNASYLDIEGYALNPGDADHLSATSQINIGIGPVFNLVKDL